jgi:hypothetical protein
MKYLWAFPALAVFIAYGIVMLPLMVLGLVLVVIFAHHQAYAIRKSRQYRGRQVLAWTARLLWLWGNEQNGIDGASGDLPAGWPHLTWSKFLQIVGWAGWRNSVGNARWTRLLGMAVDPARVKVCFASELPVNLRRGVFLVRQGWRFQFRWTYSATRQLRIGWGIAEQSGKTPLGVGFSTEPAATV